MSFMKEIGETYRCYALFRAKYLEKEGIVGSQYLYIKTICRAPGISQDELASRLVFNKSSVARQLATLEQNGFVERRRSEKDKRILLVYPTEKAKEVMPVIEGVVREFLTALGRDLSPAEREDLDRIMLTVTKNARQKLKEEDL